MSPPATAARSPWPAFVVCAFATYLTTLDLSIVNVAFPEILRDFDATRADVSWVVTVYNICFGSLLVVSGKTADRIGRRRCFLAGLVVFLAGSVLCAIAPSLGLLVAGRAVQGLGGALLTPASLGLLLGAFPPERRTQVVAMFGGIGALGVASGPSLGALLISTTDWRAAFWVNLPLGVVLVIAGARTLVESPLTAGVATPDYAGALLVTVGLALVALGISQSDVWGWADPRTLASLAVAVAIVPLFLARQRRHPEPVLDLTLFASRSFRTANAAGLVFFAGFAALGLNNVLFLRQVWGWSVLRAGLVSALAPATVAVLAPFAGKLAARIGFRPFVAWGPVIVAGSMLTYLVVLDERPATWTIILIGEITAVGIAAFIPVNAAAAVASLPPARFSVGGAVNNTARQIGSVLGIAVLVAVIGSPATPSALLDAHRRGFVLIAVTMIGAAAVSVRQVHAVAPAEERPSTPDATATVR